MRIKLVGAGERLTAFLLVVVFLAGAFFGWLRAARFTFGSPAGRAIFFAPRAALAPGWGRFIVAPFAPVSARPCLATIHL